MNRLEKAAARRALKEMQRPTQLDQWTVEKGGRFEEAYRYLRATVGMPSEVAFVCAWMSLSRDDRGEDLRTWTQLENWLCVSRESIYKWRNDYLLDEWAEQLRLLALRGQPLGEVDRVTYLQAIDPSAPVEARRLFYQRAGVLGQDITVHDKTQKEKLDDWLLELRQMDEDKIIEVEHNEPLAELGTEEGDVSPAGVRASRGATADPSE